MATVNEEIEVIGPAGCPFCRRPLAYRGRLVWVRRWKTDTPHSRSAGPGEVWHQRCALAQQREHAEERALELLSEAVTG